jgi:Domain of unknown function (DUF5667)
MLRQTVLFIAAFTFAFLILFTSVFKIAAIKYVFSQTPTPTPAPLGKEKEIDINYELPYPGGILPDSFLWPVKALRDRAWVSLSLNPLKKAQVLLLLSNKRLNSALLLFKDGKSDLGASVLTKAEKYLEESQKEERMAHDKGIDTVGFLKDYSLATLKHREVMDEIINLAPEDAKPMVVVYENYPKKLYQLSRDALLQAGTTAPTDPF